MDFAKYHATDVVTHKPADGMIVRLKGRESVGVASLVDNVAVVADTDEFDTVKSGDAEMIMPRPVADVVAVVPVMVAGQRTDGGTSIAFRYHVRRAGDSFVGEAFAELRTRSGMSGAIHVPTVAVAED